MAYTVPSLQISQEFTQLPVFSQSPLSALIIGPTYLTGNITNIALGTAGSGYTSPPVVTITDTTGVDAAVTAVLTNVSGALLTVAVSSGGTGYTNGTGTVSITISDTTGFGAQLQSVVAGGILTAINVVAGGQSYSSTPTITIAAPTSGTTATAGAVTRGTGAVASYTITNPGFGYTAPVVTVAAPGSGTTAVPGTVTLTSSRTLSTTKSASIGSVVDLDSTMLALGDINPANPLAYAVAQAVNNANGATVYYAQVATDNEAGYITALALAEKANVYYGIVPLTQNVAIQQDVVGHVNSMSSPLNAKWRTCWLSNAEGTGANGDAKVASYLASLVSAATTEGQVNDNSGPRRVHNVFPPTYVDGAGNTVNGYHLAAALAGLRSGSVPHQSLTNTQVIGPAQLPLVTSTYTETQLNTLAGSGVWIVTQALSGGTAYTRHQVTGDASNLNYREDSVVANVDSISYGLQSALAPFIGVYNISPGVLLQIRTVIDAELSYRLTGTYTQRAGNQLLNYQIMAITQDPVFQDRLNITIQIGVPYPLNYLTVNLSI